MCGITAIIDQSNQPVKELEIKTANNLIKHRGPDAEGYYFGSNFAFGHRRLAIIDLSDLGNQPMIYRDLVIIYNGEIYNYLEIRQTLAHLGYTFTSNTDTEVILAAYDHWGASCVNQFNGMWALAIYDKKKNILFCSRDRFGIKPFYYTQIGLKFCFASEIKQFTAIEGWKAKMNRNRAYEFMVWGYHDHTATETFFDRVYQLKKGHNLIYDLASHTFETICYYQIDHHPISDISWGEAKKQFKHLFTDAIRLRLRSDVKVGSALSGGLDSSSIVGSLASQFRLNQGKNKLETISACFHSAPSDESLWIDKVVQRHQILSQKVYPTLPGLLEGLKKVTWHQDEPIIGAGVFAQYKVFESAHKKGIKVMIDGQGADEILAGYNKFYYPFLRHLLTINPAQFLAEGLQAFLLHSQSPKQIFNATYQFLRKKAKKPVTWINPSFVPKPEQLFTRSQEDTIQQTSINLIYEMGISILLHYEDRNAMAFSVESRLPFLDYRLVEFCLNLPQPYKIRHGKRKYILRESMKPILPKDVYRRYDKMGYATPQLEWMEKHHHIFHQLFERAIERADGFFSDSISETKDQNLIWRTIALGTWLELFEVEV